MGSFEHNSLFAFANSSTLNIQGDLTGTGNVNSSGTVNFNSTTSNQLISVQSFSTSILILNNTKAGGGVVTIQTSLDITNTLTLTQGNLYIDNANNGELNVNLESAIINQTGTGSVSGNVTFVRTISAPKSHYLSPILDNVTMQQIHDQYQVINPVTNLTRMHQYTNGTWTPVNNLSTVLDKDGAYSLYLLQSDLDNNSNTIFITGTYTHARTKTFNFADNSSTKYYLVPNIYPNTLLWGSTSKTKLTGKIYYWDPTQTAYQTYNANTGTGSLGGTNNVGALQAFFVETDGTGGTASLTQLTSHVGTTSTAIRKTTAITPNNQFKLIVTNTITGSKDELIVHFNDDGKIVYDNYLDAIKFMNPSPTPNLYVKKATNNLVMSNYPSLNSQSDTTIQLYVKTANADNYKFEILPLGNVDPYLKITLRDSLNNYQQDILANTSYTFKGGINKTMILGLNIGSLSKTSVTTDIVQATSFYNNETITVQTNKSLGGTTNVSIYNTTGALVTQYTNVDLSSGRNEISNSNLSTGIYLMKIENKDFVTTHKLVVE
jgi:hypothetical protein